MPNVPRMRSINEVVAYFKEEDPNTQVSEYFLRTTIANGFPVIKTGKKFLINIDLFVDYLNGNYEIKTDEKE